MKLPLLLNLTGWIAEFIEKEETKMTKWKCSKPDCMRSPCVLETRTIPHNCPLLNLTTPEWEKQEEPVTAATTTDPLPKLTVEVFDRPDCPEWAKYAAVDKNGHVFVFDLEPECTHSSWYKKTRFGFRLQLSGSFDSSDYEHSLVRRPEQKQEENTLPDWCKVGEWVWLDPQKITGANGYEKVTNVDGLGLMFESGLMACFSHRILQARLRPWTFEEAPIVLKVKDPHGSALAYLSPFGGKYIIAYHRPDEYEGLKLGEVTFTFSAFADIFTQIDGSPCGVLEHLENGEWVK